MTHTHPNAERIERDFQAWSDAADAGTTRPRDIERERMEIAARIRSPKRSTADQADVNETPLFIAANEPRFL